MDILELINSCEEKSALEFKKIDKLCFKNTSKVLDSFREEQVSESDFNMTTGYGYNDVGREKIEKIFAKVLDTDDAIVRTQFISGSHALNVVFFALLRPGDTLLSISGTPYDTLHEVIGIKDNPSSLKSFGINYDEIDLVDNDFNYDEIKNYITNNKVKVIEIQRSKGYSTRKSLTLDKVNKVISFIKEIDESIIIMVDNCYCEFVEDGKLNADVFVGSLIKNLGGGIAPNGAYVAGKKELIDLVGERLTLPGEGREVGPSLGINKSILQGLFLAPSVVAASLKVAVLTACCLKELGYDVEPLYNEARADIVQNIIFNDKDMLIKYVRGIQTGSPIDSNATPFPWNMPGYDDQVIMASGSFTQGSSIEISCDGPIRSPYIAYQQGSLTYESGKYALMKALQSMENN